MKYAIGFNWENKLVDFANKLNIDSKDKIFEFFGSPAFSFFGGATTYPRIRDISLKEIKGKIKYIKDRGFKFNYLINASTFPKIDTNDDFKKAIEYLEWIKSINPSIITVGNEKTLDFITKNFPEFKINLSIVLAIKSLDRAEEFFNKYPNIKRITLHQTLNRDKEMLKKHVELAHKYDIEVELLTNEICLYDCPRMRAHYDYLGKSSQLNRPSNLKLFEYCREVRQKDPLEFLNACWIRPEDVSIYEEIGVDILKIAGRGESEEYLERVTGAFIKRNYCGNIMDLFYPTWWKNKKVPHINNALLDGFLEYLFQNGKKKLDTIPDRFKISY